MPIPGGGGIQGVELSSGNCDDQYLGHLMSIMIIKSTELSNDKWKTDHMCCIFWVVK